VINLLTAIQLFPNPVEVWNFFSFGGTFSRNIEEMQMTVLFTKLFLVTLVFSPIAASASVEGEWFAAYKPNGDVSSCAFNLQTNQSCNVCATATNEADAKEIINSVVQSFQSDYGLKGALSIGAPLLTENSDNNIRICTEVNFAK
jgi:hypothetical protein